MKFGVFDHVDLFKLKGAAVPFGNKPAYAQALAEGRIVIGSAETVARTLHDQLEGTPYNYVIGQFVFGDLSLNETQTSVRLFTEHVMPALQRAPACA